jgi:exodeoxyribonuclease VII large subunit
MEVICTGKVSAFGGSSKYQLIVEQVELAGVGALLKMIEDRRQKLAAEGLFDAARKRALPYMPRVIGVVTSPQGAVIRDILHRLRDRFPVHVLVWPAAMQGENCARDVVAGINGFNALPVAGPVPRPDLIIVARGGGAFEDLLPFNEESVVRAAAASAIPLIAAVGHETDTTLIDFAADVRAPTPTAAAELAVPVRRDLVEEVEDLDRRLRHAARRAVDDRRSHVQALSRGLRSPREAVAMARQRLDEVGERLPQALRLEVGKKKNLLAARTLRPEALRREADRARERFAATGSALERDLRRQVDLLRQRFAGAGRLLETLSYKGTLARGFAVVRGPDGVLASAAAVAPGLAARIEFHDGTRDATFGVAPRKAGRADGGGGNQGSLL